jgi:phospholipid transport system substrate-binding protein
MRRRALLVLAAAAIAGAVAAQDGPTVPIAALNEALLRIMRAGRASPFAERARTLAPVIESTFDLPQILATSVGLRWTSIPPAQQERLLDVFTRYTVASYVANFDRYDGQRLDVSSQTRAVGSDQVVSTEVVPTNGDPRRIDYVMRRTSNGWRAIDVLLDGTISRVAVQRSDFRSLIAAGDPGPLIASLQAKTTKLEAGEKS